MNQVVLVVSLLRQCPMALNLDPGRHFHTEDIATGSDDPIHPEDPFVNRKITLMARRWVLRVDIDVPIAQTRTLKNHRRMTPARCAKHTAFGQLHCLAVDLCNPDICPRYTPHYSLLERYMYTHSIIQDSFHVGADARARMRHYDLTILFSSPT
jgi:hypothetical protein